MELERREVYFSGRVQGVGFRYTTARIARHHQVTGYVKNLSDGRVQLVVEGDKRVLSSFVKDVHTHMEANISGTQSLDSDYLGEFSTFDIRH